MVKIKSYQIRKNGHRGLVVSLPAVWVEDLILQPGDKIDIYRDTHGRLCIVPPGAPAPEESFPQIQGSELAAALEAARKERP